MNSEILQGKVEWFNNKRGFGLIKADGKEYFIHHSNIVNKSNNLSVLHEKQEVSFQPGVEKVSKKLIATNVLGKDGKPLVFQSKKRHVRNKNRKKNTETFEPSYDPSDMRVVVKSGKEKHYSKQYKSNDVIIITDLFQGNSNNIYQNLLQEIKNTGIDENNLWKLWHGDTHIIADDKKNWKQNCPTFNEIINKVKEYFKIDIKATRFNWYKDSTHWKPYHHDAAAVKPDKAKTQNLTIGISFGEEREAAFQHAKTRSVISFPLPNGSIYVFSKDVNIEWRHGILPIPEKEKNDNGRISIILWGWVNMIDK